MIKDNYLIKDNDLIEDIQFDIDTTTYVLKNLNKQNKKTKLGEVFNYLPIGIIDKTETGIGGTSLELDSKRNSIIVQPFNNLAESKSQLKSFKNNYNVFFFSSNYFHESKNKSTKKLGTKANDPISRLKEYIVNCERSKQPIKIICIINQIQDLYNYLKTLKKHPIDNFYLVLDEIDTLQEHSNFRGEAAKCYNIFKVHSPEKRIMISATLMKFHDEELKNEPKTIIKYKNSNKPHIEIKNTINIKEEALRAILNLTLNDKSKIVIFCNNFEYCNDIIKGLKKEIINKHKRSIKILCSNSPKSKKIAGEYYGEMLPNGLLPADINFFTAAYFSGHDINERYHNIILAEKKSPALRLSPRIIYQITGRCRGEEGPFSNQLLLDLNSRIKIEYKIFSFKELKENVLLQDELSKFTHPIKNGKNKYMKTLIESMENVFYEGTRNVPSVFDSDENGGYKISYFKIDSRIEEQNTYKLYLSMDVFIKELRKRFSFNYSVPLFIVGDKKLIEKKDQLQLAKSVFLNLKDMNRELDYISLLQKIKFDIISPTKVQLLLLNIFKNGLDNENVNINKLCFVVEKIICSKQLKARLEELDFFLSFNNHVYNNEVFKESIVAYFPIGQVFSTLNFKTKNALLLKSYKEMSKTKSKNLRYIVNFLVKKPKLINKSLLHIQEKNTKKLRGSMILGYDKYQILGD
jgi:hypothetical protein